MSQEISQKLYQYCTNPQSVTSELAKEPSKSPSHFAYHLYGGGHHAVTEQPPSHHRNDTCKKDLSLPHICGNWGPNEPSELFLQCFHDALCSLDHDPLAGMVSPSLMGSSGVIPLSVIGTIHDVCRHMSNLIVRAQKEVFLATNYWMASDSSRFITDALRELSKRAGVRGRKVVVKIMYDRGDPKQFIENHQIMTVKQYTSATIQLPAPHEVPFLDMEVQNFHRPVLGTFHAKFMVVDRRIACVQSNNIQDNDNLEMLTHLEGPIVDSIYDTALLAWEKEMHPPFPCLDDPCLAVRRDSFIGSAYLSLFDEEGKMRVPDAGNPQEVMAVEGDHLAMHEVGHPHYDTDIESEVRRMQSALSPNEGETRMNALTRHLNSPTKSEVSAATALFCHTSEEMTPLVPHKVKQSFPIALVNRKPWGALNHQSVNVPQNEAWLSAIRNAKSSIFIQTPDLNAAPLVSALEEAVKRGVEVTYYVCLGYNDAGELLPFQGGTNEMVASKLYQQLDDEARKRLYVYYYVGKDQVKPIHNKFKARSCHIKLMIVDEHLGIQGSGNQDTQSWFHSMEINIMIDSAEVCRDWLEALRRNQNTHLYGAAYGAASQDDGIWHDENGKEADGAIGKDPGRFAWAKGFIGAIQRVRGVGGF